MFPLIHKNLPNGQCISYAWFPAMHSRVDVLIPGHEETFVRRIIQLMFEEISRLEKVLNRFSPDSELYRLNHLPTDTPYPLSAELLAVLLDCLHWQKKTEGYFDITIQSPYRGKSYSHEFSLDAENVTFTRLHPDLILDLCGYAKGWALDNIRSLLFYEGVTEALLNFGNSSICALGNQPGGEGWNVGMEDPAQPGINAHECLLINQCLTTSGNNSEERAHICNPKNGQMIKGAAHISLITPNAACGEALSTALFAANTESKQRILTLPECTGFYEY